MVAPARFELAMMESESTALPLGYGAIFFSVDVYDYIIKRWKKKDFRLLKTKIFYKNDNSKNYSVDSKD